MNNNRWRRILRSVRQTCAEQSKGRDVLFTVPQWRMLDRSERHWFDVTRRLDHDQMSFQWFRSRLKSRTNGNYTSIKRNARRSSNVSRLNSSLFVRSFIFKKRFEWPIQLRKRERAKPRDRWLLEQKRSLLLPLALQDEFVREERKKSILSIYKRKIISSIERKRRLNRRSSSASLLSTCWTRTISMFFASLPHTPASSHFRQANGLLSKSCRPLLINEETREKKRKRKLV